MSGILPAMWAFNSAPCADGVEKLVLTAIAWSADQDGCNSWQAQSTIAKRAMVDGRTVRRKIADLESRGIIARGDQRAVAHLRADKRPVVWDVMIPYTAWGDGIEEVNEWRSGKGREPLTARNRPSLGPAPEPKRRADKGKAKQDEKGGGTSRPAGLEVPPDTESTNGRTSSPEREDFKSYNHSLDQSPMTSTTSETAQPSLAVADGGSSTRAIGTRRESENREDVERVCQHLVDRIVENGGRKPTITKKWRDEARLLMDRDGIREDQVHRAIDWCQGHSFWRSNILSMPTLREKYDQLRLQALRETEAPRTPSNVHHGPDESRQKIIAAFTG